MQYRKQHCIFKANKKEKKFTNKLVKNNKYAKLYKKKVGSQSKITTKNAVERNKFFPRTMKQISYLDRLSLLWSWAEAHPQRKENSPTDLGKIRGQQKLLTDNATNVF